MVSRHWQSNRSCRQELHTVPGQMEPLNMTTLPRGPWVSLNIDLCGPLPSGEYLLNIIDEYSRYTVVQVVQSTSADTVIPCTEAVFVMFGYPETIKSDIGAPFQSKAWSDFLRSHGVCHRKITPLWPMANSQAENFNKPLMKAVHSSNVQCCNGVVNCTSYSVTTGALHTVPHCSHLIDFFSDGNLAPIC